MCRDHPMWDRPAGGRVTTCQICRAEWGDAPIALVDTRPGLGLCALKEEDFQALEALKGKRVRLVVVE